MLELYVLLLIIIYTEWRYFNFYETQKSLSKPELETIIVEYNPRRKGMLKDLDKKP